MPNGVPNGNGNGRPRQGRGLRRVAWIDAAIRSVRYYVIIPLFRSPHPPEYTARGVATGLFWGLTPLFGIQTIIIVATWATAKRIGRELSLIQALAWGSISNPLTVVPIYYVFFVTGHLLTGEQPGGYAMFAGVFERTLEASETWWGAVVHATRFLGVTTLLGSLPWAIGASLVGYAWAGRIVRRKRERGGRRAPDVQPV